MTWEINFITWFQSLGGEGSFLFYIQNFFSILGEIYFILPVLMFLYWIWDKDTAEFVTYSITVSSCANTLLKNIIKRNRPFNSSREIQNLRDVGGYSYPSGHSQQSSAMCSAIGYKIPRKWILVLAIIIPLLVGQSRTYVGAHFPTDVFGGLAMGLFLTMLSVIIYGNVKNRNHIYYVTLAIFFPVLFFELLIPYFKTMSSDFYISYGIMLGFMLGMMFERRFVNFRETRNVKVAIMRFVVGLAIVLVIFFGLGELIKLFTVGRVLAHWISLVYYAIVLFVAFALVPWLFVKIERRLFTKTDEPKQPAEEAEA